jgi:hypothetical protein
MTPIERATDKTGVELYFGVIASLVGARSMLARMRQSPTSDTAFRLVAAAEVVLVVAFVVVLLVMI